MKKGRNCSLEYLLPTDWINKAEDLESSALYVVGGLYGNIYALEKIKYLAAKENAKVVFNGDIHWFDVCEEDFLNVENNIINDIKLLGNVEYELISNRENLGCGCNYPEDVDEGVVERSNVIHDIMKENLQKNKILDDIKKRKKTAVYNFLGKKIAITHGDEKNMAGWACSIDNLQNEERQKELEHWLKINNIDILATTHTCLPTFYQSNNKVVINNGAAGMANIENTTYGLITRISKEKSNNALISIKSDDVYVELIKIDFDIDKFITWFDKVWPKGSPAEVSYRNRILKGTDLKLEQLIGGSYDKKCNN